MTEINDFAPYPECEDDATVEAMTRNALVASWANNALARSAMREGRPDMDRVAGLFRESSVEQLDVAWLLTELAEVAPERAVAAARRMWRQRFDGGAVHELTWDRLSAAGIDPDGLATVAEDAWRSAPFWKDAA